MNQKRNQFTFYRSFLESVRRQPTNVQNAFFQLVIRYALDGVEPGEEEDALVLSLFVLVRPTLDSAFKKSKKGNRDKCGQYVKEKYLSKSHHEGEGEIEVEVENEKEIEIEFDSEIEIENEIQGAGLALPTLEKELFPIFPKTITTLQDKYPGVDVVQEFEKIKAWFSEDVGRLQPANKLIPFVYRWMGRNAERIRQGDTNGAGREPELPTTSDAERVAFLQKLVARNRKESEDSRC